MTLRTAGRLSVRIPTSRAVALAGVTIPTAMNKNRITPPTGGAPGT